MARKEYEKKKKRHVLGYFVASAHSCIYGALIDGTISKLEGSVHSLI
jgi:hypothetical protein